MKLLLNYDYNLFPFTTASYIEDAAYEIKGIEVMHRNDYQMRKPDLIFNIMPFEELAYNPGVPSCYWEIDCHLIRGMKEYLYDNVDKVYIAQEHFLSYYPKKKTSVLPLACDPAKHMRILGQEQKYDIGFIGNDTYGPRRTLLEQLATKYKVLRTNSVSGVTYSTLLSQCKLLFNRSLDNDVNMRFFESIAIGRLLLTDFITQQDKFAVDGEHYVSYNNWYNLDQACKYYLEHDKERERIAFEGACFIRKNETYRDRLLKVLGDFGWKKFS